MVKLSLIIIESRRAALSETFVRVECLQLVNEGGVCVFYIHTIILIISSHSADSATRVVLAVVVNNIRAQWHECFKPCIVT